MPSTGKGQPSASSVSRSALARRVVNFEALLEEGMINPEDLSLFGYADSAEEIWEELLRQGLQVPEAGKSPPT